MICGTVNQRLGVYVPHSAIPQGTVFTARGYPIPKKKQTSEMTITLNPIPHIKKAGEASEIGTEAENLVQKGGRA
jgi:hypothetical protein